MPLPGQALQALQAALAQQVEAPPAAVRECPACCPSGRARACSPATARTHADAVLDRTVTCSSGGSSPSGGTGSTYSHSLTSCGCTLTVPPAAGGQMGPCWRYD